MRVDLALAFPQELPKGGINTIMLKTLLAVVLTVWLTPALTSAQQTAAFPDKFSLSVGGFLMNYTRSFLAFDPPGRLLGATIDLTDDLNQDGSSGVLRVDSYFRFSPRHRVDLTWYRFSRDGQARLERSLQIGPEEFGVGTDLDSKTVNNLLKFGYTYSFFHIEEVELGVGVGFHFIDLQFDANASDPGQEVSEGGLLPLPNLGLIVDYQISSRFRVPVQFQIFFLEGVGDYRGSLTDFTVGLEFRAFRNFGLGAGYNRFTLEASAKETDFSGFANTTFNGFLLYLVGKL